MGKGVKLTEKRSSDAGFQFPLGHIHCLQHKGNYAERVGVAAPVCLSVVILPPTSVNFNNTRKGNVDLV